jgi:hypothetical protein
LKEDLLKNKTFISSCSQRRIENKSPSPYSPPVKGGEGIWGLSSIEKIFLISTPLPQGERGRVRGNFK